jgi:hypothetical protein
MLRAALIGAGNIEYHYQELLHISKEEFNEQIKQIAKVLAETKTEIVLLPDKGVCMEIAKLYKQSKGPKVIATIPKDDKDFGIKHLEPYINAKIYGRKVIDKEINTKTWYKQDLIVCTFGDFILMLGNSLGALGELTYAYYMYKLFKGMKKGVSATEKKIHPEIRAGKNIPFTVIAYKPFLKEKLNFEIEKYIHKLGGKIIYVNSIKELKQEIAQLA